MRRSLVLDGFENDEIATQTMTTEPLDLPEHRKARGAFFTPQPVSDFATNWAVRSADDSVLEPSCGEAVFLVSAAQRLKTLGAPKPRLSGFELHAPSAAKAQELLLSHGVADAEIWTGDFLAVTPTGDQSAVVGNPPYIRYHGFTGEARATGRRAAEAQGVHLTSLASSWAPFVIHSAAFLKPEGRMALVLPAELLSSNYAASVRAFLLRRFSTVKIVLFDAQVFPGVQTEALLLLAEGHGGTNRVQFGRVHRASDLAHLQFAAHIEPTDPAAKWTTALVNAGATASLQELLASDSFQPLTSWGRVRLGMVTGANTFFTMSPRRADELGLAETDFVRISPPGSTHLRHLSLTQGGYDALAQSGARTLLFRPEVLSPAARAYIAQGEATGVSSAYKCRIRNPWWRTPLVSAPDMFFTYMNADTVQLCANPLGLHHLNSVHGLYLEPNLQNLRFSLAIAALNSATMLSAETVGRAYGGGILKMEPREAAQLAVPSPTLVARLQPMLQRAAPTVRAALRRGDLPAAVTAVDTVILSEGLGLPADDIHDLRRGRNLLAHRRRSRARGGASK